LANEGSDFSGFLPRFIGFTTAFVDSLGFSMPAGGNPNHRFDFTL
jgi:hypothetical protein